jgi:hypothetical protein
VACTGSGRSRRAHAAGVVPVGAVGRLRRGICARRLHRHGDAILQHGAGARVAAALPHHHRSPRCRATGRDEHGEDKNRCCNCNCKRGGPHGRSMDMDSHLTASNRSRSSCDQLCTCCDVRCVRMQCMLCMYIYTPSSTGARLDDGGSAWRDQR